MAAADGQLGTGGVPCDLVDRAGMGVLDRELVVLSETSVPRIAGGGEKHTAMDHTHILESLEPVAR